MAALNATYSQSSTSAFHDAALPPEPEAPTDLTSQTHKAAQPLFSAASAPQNSDDDSKESHGASHPFPFFVKTLPSNGGEEPVFLKRTAPLSTSGLKNKCPPG